MAEQQATSPKLPEAAEQMARLQRIAERSRRVAELWLSAGGKTAPSAVPATLAHDFLEAGIRLLGQPQHLLQAQVQLWQDYLTLWHRSARRLFGQDEQTQLDGKTQ